ncbi:MAG: tripartite tricarboxylate transporter substrate binding protein [Natronospirillum sp.]
MKNIKTTLLGVTLVVASSMSWAQDYPTRNISLVSPYPPGGTSDLVARAISGGFENALGRTVTVVNRAGAGGAVGGGFVAGADPNGYTLGLLTTTPLLMAPLNNDLPYGAESFEYVCRAFDNPLILTARNDADYDDLAGFLEYAQNSPTPIRYYTAGAGGLQDVATVAFASRGDFEGVAIPLSGDQPAVQNLLSGVINVAMLTSGVILSNPDGLKPIAVMSTDRLNRLPNVPTFLESGYDLNYSLWGAIVAPKGTPDHIVATLGNACEVAMQGPEFERLMGQLSMEVLYQSGKDFEPLFMTQVENTLESLREMGFVD